MEGVGTEPKGKKAKNEIKVKKKRREKEKQTETQRGLLMAMQGCREVWLIIEKFGAMILHLGGTWQKKQQLMHGADQNPIPRDSIASVNCYLRRF